jgi:hypothetical protein
MLIVPLWPVRTDTALEPNVGFGELRTSREARKCRLSGADTLFGSVALCFGERILDLRNGFLRPIEIDSRGKTLLK